MVGDKEDKAEPLSLRCPALSKVLGLASELVGGALCDSVPCKSVHKAEGEGREECTKDNLQNDSSDFVYEGDGTWWEWCKVHDSEVALWTFPFRTKQSL